MRRSLFSALAYASAMLCEVAMAQSSVGVRDVIERQTWNGPLFPGGFLTRDGVTYFSAYDSVHGSEL